MVNVVFVHPDLGIGGAERAVIDAALALKSSGHQVQIVTTHHDRSHCFEETRDGQLPVICVGDWLPRSLFSRCRALCAYIRMIYAAIYIVFFSGLKYDVIFCDQISACIPFFRCKCGRSTKVSNDIHILLQVLYNM
jgi:alpha-1,3/alpha-1,6-mannosyltransferase